MPMALPLLIAYTLILLALAGVMVFAAARSLYDIRKRYLQEVEGRRFRMPMGASADRPD